jgi:hypothetical protein
MSPKHHTHMDAIGIANLATGLTAASLSDQAGVAVLKKALDIQATNAAALVEAMPAVPSVNLPAHLGRNIDTTA